MAAAVFETLAIGYALGLALVAVAALMGRGGE